MPSQGGGERRPSWGGSFFAGKAFKNCLAFAVALA